MSELVASSSSTAPLPLPSVNVSIRPGVLSDVPFLDSLQKRHTEQVGWMPTKQFEGKIELGQVLVAETNVDGGLSIVDSGGESNPQSTFHHPQSPTPVGYCIGHDQYFKRDDVGIIYQMNVLPGKQRGLIGATLLKAMFDRAAYGCKLYCCWCAQDIAANRFWEAMGFVPLAFRAGSEKKSRVHIFWQMRIRANDTTTPWWFPSKTAGGSIREDRIVLPIPPGTRWSDAKPLILPSEEPVVRGQLSVVECGKQRTTDNGPTPSKAKRAASVKAIDKPAPVRRNGLLFDIPKQGEPLPEAKSAKEAKPKAEKVKRVCDPKLVAAARELRDRWLERVNADPAALASQGRYEVSKQLDAGAERTLLLPDRAAA